MKPNDSQQRYLEEINQKHVALKTHRAQAWVRHEQMIRDELAVLRVELSQACNKALTNGVSKTRIGRAMGTANWGTILGVLALTDPAISPGEANGARGDGWTYDADTKVLTLHEWRNMRTNQMEKKPALEVRLEVVDNELRTVDGIADVYRKGADISWFGLLLDRVNGALGYRSLSRQTAVAEESATVPTVTDYDEMFRQAALHANDDEDED